MIYDNLDDALKRKVLSENLINDLKLMHVKLFPIIGNMKKNVRIFVVQLRNDEITVGGNVRSTYKPIYYNSYTKRDHDDEIKQILEEFNDTIVTIFHEIIKNRPKFKSYNIYFAKKSIHVCKNALGARSIGGSELFEHIDL